MDTVTKNAPGGQPPRVKRVAAINDLSGFGRCSLTVALPILSAMGFQVCPAPTMLLSAHTGYPAPFIRDMTADLPAYLAHWERLGLEFEAVYTGFLGAPRQAALLEPFLQSQIRAGALCLVDPAMADHGRLYATCTPALVEAMKRLVALAAICTPNVTEACLLTDTDYDALAALPPAEQQAALYRVGTRLRALGCGTVVITGVPAENGAVANLVVDAEHPAGTAVTSRRVDRNFAGTGDVFSAVLCGSLLQGQTAVDAVRRAADFVYTTLVCTASLQAPEQDGVVFEPFLSALAKGESL